MEYKVKDIQKILDFKTWDDKRKIDALLKIDASNHDAIGTESSRGEMKSAIKASRKLYEAIETIDKEQGSLYLRAMDE